MAEVEKIKEDLEVETPNEEVNIELEGETPEAEKIRDRAEIIDEFYENVALKLIRRSFTEEYLVLSSRI